MRLIDADSVKDFFFSETSGTEETISDLAEKHNLTYLNDVNEDEVMSFAKDLLEAVQNVIETESTAYDSEKVVSELDKLADKANDKILEAGELQLYYDGYEDGMRTAVEVVKGGGVDAF